MPTGHTHLPAAHQVPITLWVPFPFNWLWSLTLHHVDNYPLAGLAKPERRKASGRGGQLEACFLLWQVYFSLQLCLTKMSLCGGHFLRKG